LFLELQLAESPKGYHVGYTLSLTSRKGSNQSNTENQTMQRSCVLSELQGQEVHVHEEFSFFNPLSSTVQRAQTAWYLEQGTNKSIY
jgi:hypothetical protein